MKKIFYPLKVLWACWYFFIFSFVFLLFYPLFAIWLSKEKWYPKANALRRVWAWLLFLFTGILYSVRFQSRLNKKQPYIFCPNHTSYLDIPLFAISLKRHFRFMAKVELGKIPLFNIFFRTIDISVNRNSITESVKALQEAGESLDKGYDLVIFPEGKIALHPPHLERFKSGPFRLAIEKQVPIVPVTFRDNWKLLYVGKKFFGRPGIAHAFVHSPIPTKGMTMNDVDALKEKVYNIINKKLIEHGSK